jgi:hypothetical protein
MTMEECQCEVSDQVREFVASYDCIIVWCEKCGDEIERIYRND